MNPLMRVVALEERASQNRKSVETEVVIYAEMGDVGQLKKASRIEHHLQLESSFKNKKGRIRARAVHIDGHTRYESTLKHKKGIDDKVQSVVSISNENTIRVDEDFFNAFSHTADHALMKTRFIFHSKKVEMRALVEGSKDPKHYTIPNVEFEVDVFIDKSGNISPICKIDVEIDGIYNYLTKEHPELGDTGITLLINTGNLPFKTKNAELAVLEKDKEKYDEFWDSIRLEPSNASMEKIIEVFEPLLNESGESSKDK